MRRIQNLQELAASRRGGGRRPRRRSGGPGKGIAIAVIVAGLLIAGTLIAIEMNRQHRVRQAVKDINRVFDRTQADLERLAAEAQTEADKAMASLGETREPPAHAGAMTYTERPTGVIAGVDARALARLYSTNEIRADAQYRDAWLSVTGRIDRLGREADGRPRVRLIGRYDVGIRCTLVRGRDGDLLNVNPQNKVTVVGKCRGLDGDVRLVECRVQGRE